MKKFHAHKVIRAMTKSFAPLSIGVDGFSLVSVIAMTEDAINYREGAKFANLTLMQLLCFANVKKLERVRKICEKYGWLKIIKGNKGKVPQYFSQIPQEYNDYVSAIISENRPFSIEEKAECACCGVVNNVANVSFMCRSCVAHVSPKCPHSIPTPKPIPKPIPILKNKQLVLLGSDIFERFWKAFPTQRVLDKNGGTRGDKKSAKEAWSKIPESEYLKIEKSVMGYKKSLADEPWKPSCGVSVYLNQGRWDNFMDYESKPVQTPRRKPMSDVGYGQHMTDKMRDDLAKFIKEKGQTEYGS